MLKETQVIIKEKDVDSISLQGRSAGSAAESHRCMNANQEVLLCCTLVLLLSVGEYRPVPC